MEADITSVKANNTSVLNIYAKFTLQYSEITHIKMTTNHKFLHHSLNCQKLK